MSLRKLSLIAVTISLCTLASAMENSNQPQPSPTPAQPQKSVAIEGLKGAAIAKGGVSLVGHGAIAVISAGAGLVGGPAAGYGAWTALETFFGPGIEAYSYKAALIGSVAGASKAEEYNAALRAEPKK